MPERPDDIHGERETGQGYHGQEQDRNQKKARSSSCLPHVNPPEARSTYDKSRRFRRQCFNCTRSVPGYVVPQAYFDRPNINERTVVLARSKSAAQGHT